MIKRHFNILEDGKKPNMRKNMHNDFLSMLSKRGIIGALSLLFLYFAIFKLTFNKSNSRLLQMFIIATITTYIGTGFSADPLSFGNTEVVFFGFLISIFALLRKEEIFKKQ